MSNGAVVVVWVDFGVLFLEAQAFSLAQMPIRITNVQFSNEVQYKYKSSAFAGQPLFWQYPVMRPPYFFVLIISKLKTIVKINEKYLEKCLQLSKKVVYLYQQSSK